MCLMVKAKCIRNTYKNGDYRIFNWSPIKNYKDGDKLKLSNYFTFSTKGNDTYIDENKEYELELEEISSDAKWGGTYKIVSCPSIMKLDLEKMTIEQKKEILLDCTSSERIANNILTAYPNFIELILTEGKESIDIKKIKGVGEVYLNCYSRNLIEKYKYYAILQKFKEYKLDISDCKALIATFKDENGIDSMLKENPYMVNIECLGRSFEYSDRIIMGLREDLRVSEQRCAYLILSVLQKNEMNGSTRLNGNDLYYYILNEYNVPELEPLIVPTAKENPLFFYDEESKDLSIMATYSAECQISNFVKNKIENSKVLDIDWEKYTSTKDGFKMSEKQSMALKMFCENNFMILAGYSGSGKAQPIDTIIPTPNGNKRLGDIKVGDYVFDRLGKPTKVLGVYPQGEREVFKVTLKDGRSTLCNDEHLWSYYTTNDEHLWSYYTTNDSKLKTSTLREMIDNGIITNDGSYKYLIPSSKSVEYDEKELSIEPYIFGKHIIEEVAYIPNEYKHSSLNQRLKLLAGLFSENKTKNSFSTTKLRLAKDVMEVLYSLGYSCSLYNEDNRNYKVKLSIDCLDSIPISNIEDLGYTTEMVCIYVDNDEHLYLTNDYIVTHNTTSLKGIINLMEDSGLTYTLLAPTGKASKRMTESTNRPSSTIHRQVLRNGHISTDVLIVDETSMVDLNTFIMMLNAIDNEDIRVVLVGDNAQLMPVGIGCIFNDLINSGVVPMIMLDEVFRYDTDGGLFVATNIRQGKPFFDSDKVTKIGNTYSICDNYKFIQTDDILSTIVSEYNKLISKGVKPNEILCLSPFNVGDEGSYRINNAIQVEVNPPKPNGLYLSRKIDNSKTEVVFRLGDRVLNKKNDYQSLPLESYNLIEESNGLLTENDVETTSIFNGQDGVIRDIDDKKIVAQFDEELIVINKAKLNNMLLSYCISVHSSQGSEAKYVLNVVSPNHKRMLNRNLLYVADTRAKVLQIDIGDMGTFNDALIIDGNLERNTWLKELLVVD